MRQNPRILLAAATLLGLAIVASSAFVMFRAATASPLQFFSVGFEAIALFAGAIAVLVGRGKFAEGPGLALLCVAGVVFVAAAVSYTTPRAIPLYDTRMLRDPFTLARLGTAGAAGALGALFVLLRNPALSFRRLALGLLWTGVAFALASPAIFARGALSGLNPVLTTVGGLVAFVVFVSFLSAGVHFIILAFEAGKNPQTGGPAAGRPAS
ncbi:MAG: hypothetical protein IBJ10_05945 [Phycisphaerales bacterium]|nr:hypothetical protein [Phycisphaerales bacterium]